MKAEVSSMAFDLFADAGYEATTVESICAVAGISRSTFFRYFSSKDDALLGDTGEAGIQLAAALEARPDSETPWRALRNAMEPLIAHYANDPERALRLARLISTTPSLAAWHQEKNARWHQLLRPEISRRLSLDADDSSDPRPAALIASALGCVDAAIFAWVASGEGSRLGEMLDRAMGSVAE
jgi:AcrR family transcriptional regulator